MRLHNEPRICQLSYPREAQHNGQRVSADPPIRPDKFRRQVTAACFRDWTACGFALVTSERVGGFGCTGFFALDGSTK